MSSPARYRSDVGSLKETGKVIFVMSLPIMDLRIPCAQVSDSMMTNTGTVQAYPERNLGPVIGIHLEARSDTVFVALEGTADVHAARDDQLLLILLFLGCGCNVRWRQLADFDLSGVHSVEELILNRLLPRQRSTGRLGLGREVVVGSYSSLDGLCTVDPVVSVDLLTGGRRRFAHNLAECTLGSLTLGLGLVDAFLQNLLLLGDLGHALLPHAAHVDFAVQAILPASRSLEMRMRSPMSPVKLLTAASYVVRAWVTLASETMVLGFLEASASIAARFFATADILEVVIVIVVVGSEVAVPGCSRLAGVRRSVRKVVVVASDGACTREVASGNRHLAVRHGPGNLHTAPPRVGHADALAVGLVDGQLGGLPRLLGLCLSEKLGATSLLALFLLGLVLGPLNRVVQGPEPALRLDLVVGFEGVLDGGLSNNLELCLLVGAHVQLGDAGIDGAAAGGAGIVLVLVVAQDTVLENEPSELVSLAVVRPLFEVALHLSRLPPSNGVSRGGSSSALGSRLAENGLLLDASLSRDGSGGSLQHGARDIILGDVLGELALAVSAEGIGSVKEENLDELSVLLAGGLVEEGSAGLDGRGFGRELGAVDVEDLLEAGFLQHGLQGLIVILRNQTLDLPDLVLGEERARELQQLEDVGVPGDVDGQPGLVVGDSVVDLLLIEQEFDDLGPPLGRRDVQRGIAILVPRVDVDGSGTVGQDVLDDLVLGALYRKVQDGRVVEAAAAEGVDGGDARARAALGGVPYRFGNGGGVAAPQGLDDAELANRLLEGDALFAGRGGCGTHL
ncbi:LOW QUALITY PROTEIN: hypothetical protein ColTof3_09756 [Colletotrichum tofieldiae]|nr:LOW QUALITY PROTEIN: hypothetical protein ColTof3_09756 [Colletotrichum tofieldiae]